MSTLLGHHADRPVRLASCEGRAVVVKRYVDADGARIFAEHRALWSALGGDAGSVAIPRPLAYDESSRELTMVAVGGAPVGARGHLGRAGELAGPTAALLARLHQADVAVRRVRDAGRIVASLRRKALDMQGTVDGRRYRRAVELLDDPIVLRRVERQETLVTSHGDWSPRNVLADGRTLHAIDFDRLQMAGAAHDVAYWGAWCWATKLVALRTPDWSMCADFTAEYVSRRPEAFQQVVDTLWFHRAAALLRIAHGWSILQAAPLLRRKVIIEAARWAAQA